MCGPVCQAGIPFSLAKGRATQVWAVLLPVGQGANSQSRLLPRVGPSPDCLESPTNYVETNWTTQK